MLPHYVLVIYTIIGGVCDTRNPQKRLVFDKDVHFYEDYAKVIDYRRVKYTAKKTII